jgi:transcriptional regulator with XRE-family HTH domain
MGRHPRKLDLSTRRGRIGARIRSEREKVFGTQQEFADAIRVSRSAVAMWELGLAMPAVDALYVIAAALEIHVSRLLPPQ